MCKKKLIKGETYDTSRNTRIFKTQKETKAISFNKKTIKEWFVDLNLLNSKLFKVVKIMIKNNGFRLVKKMNSDIPELEYPIVIQIPDWF